MLHFQRVLFSDNGTLSDITTNTGDFRTGSEVIDYTTAEDYIFIGSFLPFNHKHFDILVANDQATVPTIEMWDGTQWRANVDVIDRTAVSGVSMAQDGIVSWSTNIDYSWNRENESADVTGLTGTNIYNMFWVRLSWDASWNALTSLEFIGQKFSNDSELYDIYPNLNNSTIQASFETGKSDWNEQHYLAAEQIVRDLKKDSAIVSGDQILDFDIFKETSIHACAEIIYRGLEQEEKMNNARARYKENLKVGYLNLDLNQDGNLSPGERVHKQGFMSR